MHRISSRIILHDILPGTRSPGTRVSLRDFVSTLYSSAPAPPQTPRRVSHRAMRRSRDLLLAVLCLSLNVAHAVFHITQSGGSAGSYSNNRLECQRLGGDLATIKNADENAEILGLVQEHFQNVGQHLSWNNPAYYIGLYMPHGAGQGVVTPANGTFVWADGTTYDESAYTNWWDDALPEWEGCGSIPRYPLSECLLEKRPYMGNDFYVSMIYDDADHLGEWKQYVIAGFGVCDIPVETIMSKPEDPEFPFFMSGPQQTYAGVKNDCISKGGVIASIRNEKENYEVGTLYSNFVANGVTLLHTTQSWNYRIWVGLEYNAGTAVWEWEDGTPFQYSHWKLEANYASFEPQPNNLPVETNVMLKGTGGRLYPWWENAKTSWTDRVDSKVTNYGVCRKAPWPAEQECTQVEFFSSGCNANAACAYNGTAYTCTCPEGWTTVNDGTGPDGCEAPVTNCSAAQKENLCPNAEQCLEKTMFGDISYECCTGTSCSAPTCIEADKETCHQLAYCSRKSGSSECECPEGLWGDGVGPSGCNSEGWTVRMVLNLPTSVVSQGVVNKKLARFEDLAVPVMKAMQGISWNTPLPATQHLPTQHQVWETNPGEYQVTLNVIFPTKKAAEDAKQLFDFAVTLDQVRIFDLVVNERVYYNNWWTITTAVFDTIGPRVYTWIAKTTSQEYPIKPTGLDVTSVSFRPNCLASGCWVVDVIYTVGEDNFNVFYVPKTDIQATMDDLSYDYDYGTVPASAPWSDYSKSPASTFLPSNFPCTSAAYVPSDPVLKKKVTSCCIPEFLAMYSPVQDFADAINGNSELAALIAEGSCDLDSPPTFSSSRRAGTEFGKPEYSFFDTFSGMSLSYIAAKEIVDPYIGQFKATLFLDEVELRNQASMLKGTVGVEHTLDTFVGLAEFKPTGSSVLDTFTKQVNIHLEKTSFFSVSTHGVNAYTFLEYVNMRLVSILKEDRDFSGVSTGTGASGDANGDDEAGSRTVRTNSTGNVNYVQVTFTLGSQYGVNDNPNEDKYESGLIPLNSVRVGRGTFLDTTRMEHVCQEYAEAEDDNDDRDQLVGLSVGRVTKGDFDDAADQLCGPQASMCASPSSIPDQFVSFNIPLGSEVFDGQASNDLSNNVFVDFVVNALDTKATGAPNNGDAPQQMKTTLTASIPIVAGGVNIFCDGFTAKTDLKDVANADIIVGTASGADELTRLRIIENVASTDLSAVNSTQIDTPSIESALMTLVLRGNESYFATGASQTGGYSLELDDLITLHLMEGGEAGTVVDGVASNSKEAALMALLNEPADDNSDSNGLDTDGYKLNGAFKFNIARADGIAKLEPTAELLAICPFNPPRPAAGNVELETCITRRDVRSRGYPARTGSPFPTAMEIFNSGVMGGGVVSAFDEADELGAMDAQVATGEEGPCQGDSDYSKASFQDTDYACEAGFMTSILGDSEYARKLAKDFVAAIRTRYDLNGRYTRAFWINPGYEWTPTQTDGKSRFQVSQKVYLFALITLDENWGRRRMLLQADPTASSGSGAAGAKLEVAVTPRSMLASSFDVPEDKVAVFEVELQLTRTEACAPTLELQSRMRDTMDDYLSTTASAFLTAQITRVSVDMGDEQCGSRRALRQLLSDWSSATAKVQLMVVFAKGAEATFNDKAFMEMAGVIAITAGANNKVNIDDKFKCLDCSPGAAKDASSDSDSDKTALIAGVCGGVGGVVLVGAGVMLWMRSRKGDEAVMAAPVQSIDINDLKAQLQHDV